MSAEPTCRMRRTAAVGSANSSSPASSSTTRSSASDSGKLSVMLVPLSISDWTRTAPPRRSTTLLTTSMPTPRPETSVADERVLKPGWKIKSRSCSGDQRSISLADANCRLVGHGSQHLQVDPASVVFQRDQNAVALLLGRENQMAGRGFAEALANLGGLDAMIHRVADQVNQRLGDLLDDFLVELGLAAANLELDFLAEGARQVADRPRERVEHRRDRQHRQLDDVLAQLFGDEIQAHAIVAEADQKLAHAPRDRIERVGMLGELCAAIELAGFGCRDAPRARDRAAG